MQKKSNYIVSRSYISPKTENWLVENETKEDAKYIVENQNQNPLYKCTLLSEKESDGDYDDCIVKEVSFEKTKDGKHFDWKEIEGNK